MSPYNKVVVKTVNGHPGFTDAQAGTFGRMIRDFFQEPGVEEDFQRWLIEYRAKQEAATA